MNFTILRLALAVLILPAAFAGGQVKAPEDPFVASLKTELQETEKALAETPNSLSLLSAAGNGALFVEKYADAVKYFRRMIELDAAQDAPHWRLGIAYYFNKQYAESSLQFKKYHAHDGRDRENGIWKFLGDVRQHDLARARTEMLDYHVFDREPFPALYDLYAGKINAQEFDQGLEIRRLTQDPRVMFFALYYSGLYEEFTGHHAAALAKVDSAVALFTSQSASDEGPGYMWQVARVHAQWLRQNPAGVK